MRVFALLASLAVAAASVHVRPDLSLGWRVATKQVTDNLAHDDLEVSFLLSLRNQNMDRVHEMVEKVTDPRSKHYTKYLSANEIAELTRPDRRDVKTVMRWLVGSGLSFELAHNGFAVRVTGRAADAAALLQTEFEVLLNADFPTHLVRATDFTLPADVEAAVSAVFGLHGLPLPAKTIAFPNAPANVTPAVIASTYSVSGVKPSGEKNNRMAVAEFQGQTMKDSDLVSFFKDYVKDAKAGDDKVYAFKGDPNRESGQVEASLDIQYMMGVAPHVKAEFWLFQGMDFCQDLVEWTANLTAGQEGLNVHSISYGWQGNLTQVQCTDAKVKTIDDNFAKLALAGVSVIFASGDSGSGYAPHSNCMSPGNADTAFEGTVEKTETVPEAQLCCEIAGGSPYTFTPIKKPPSPGNTCQGTDIGTKGIAYTGVARQIFHVPQQDAEICCHLSGELGGLKFTFSPDPQNPKEAICTLFSSTNGTLHKKGSYAGKASPTRREGKCEVFSKVTGTKKVTGATSGGNNGPAALPVLWPSWPASSPYITAVGATRFVDQKVGRPEMATDQFGSGGGFSKQFGQSPHAKYQIEAVKHYVDNPPKDPHYPPAGSFPTTGRATPDVSALGEGYQVYVNGRVTSVGGTSASTPAFAGLVALINEARIQAGKKPMGFLNPFLYQNADCFTDVTLGTNAIGRGNGPIKYGFNATKGWDPATGLGTPKFEKLLAAALKA